MAYPFDKARYTMDVSLEVDEAIQDCKRNFRIEHNSEFLRHMVYDFLDRHYYNKEDKLEDIIKYQRRILEILVNDNGSTRL